MGKWLNNIILSALLFIYPSFISAQKSSLFYDRIVRDNTSEYYNMPVGLCEDYPEETTTPQIIKNDFEFLKKEKVKLLRISFGWDAIESEKGKYNWLFWDDYVKTAVDEYGITLVPYICYTPPWISTGDSTSFWNYPPKDNKAFADFVKNLVTRYKDRIKTWELWNEPDIKIYWQGTQEEFAQFIKAGAQAVKQADPDAKVVLGGIAYDPDFIMHMFRDYGLSHYIDIVNCHNYFETWHRHSVEEITTYLNEIQDIIWRYGDKQALWVAEVGYSTFRKGSHVSESYDAYYKYEHTAEYQPAALFKILTIIRANENVEAVAWYELKDLHTGEEVIGDNDNNRFLGVAYSDWRPKPAATALTFFNDLFSQKSKCIDNIVKTDIPVKSDVQVHSFQNEDGSIIICAWLKTSNPGSRGNDRSGNAIDKRKQKIAVTIPLLNINYKTAILYDELGMKKKFPGSIKKESSASSIIINDIELFGKDVTILKLTK